MDAFAAEDFAADLGRPRRSRDLGETLRACPWQAMPVSSLTFTCVLRLINVSLKIALLFCAEFFGSEVRLLRRPESR